MTEAVSLGEEVESGVVRRDIKPRSQRGKSHRSDHTTIPLKLMQ